MSTKKESKFVTRGFKEEFWSPKEKESLEGVFLGFIEKTIDGEKRTFAAIKSESNPKPFICGGRDLLNKLEPGDKGKEVKITFLEKGLFTPKGTKKKVAINRYEVLVAE